MQAFPPAVAILGGGIGGLTMANALRSVGLEFDLYEQAKQLTEVGAGIGLSRGALTLLDALELGEEVRAEGSWIKGIYLADKHLNIRRKLPANFSGICIHRATLVDILQRRLPPERIHLSRRATDVQNHADHVEISFSDGRIVTAPSVVAADGIHSITRRKLLPEIAVRYIGQTIWRGITTMQVPPLLRDSYIEVWDEGLRFLTVPIGGDDTFWLAVKRASPGTRDDPATERHELLELFRNFHPVFRDLIRYSRGFLRDDMGDLGNPGRHPWHVGRVVFLGDAIHATTPNLAQGGCQAMEDALCLAHCIVSDGTDLEPAFRKYRELRKKKVSFVVDTSWRFGVAAHSRNPIRYHGFRAILEHAPASFLARRERFLADLSYLRQVGFP